MLALAPNTFGTLLWPLPDAAPPPPAVPAPPSFLRSVMPALDRAFGLPDPWDLPDDLAALTAWLRAGPLGARSDATPAAGPVRLDAVRIHDGGHSEAATARTQADERRSVRAGEAECSETEACPDRP